MIQANELRIGNWVYWAKTTWNIGSEDFRLLDSDTDEMPFDPIPITPEILEKAGFVKDDESGYYELQIGNNVSLRGDIETMVICESGQPYIDVPIKYVHKLQNIIFALTGEELNITL